jgi:hypothetical protein
MNAMDIKEHMEVIGSEGGHVGTVDHMSDDNLIKLTRSDTGGDKHHFIPLGWVESVDSQVHLSKSADEAKMQWKSE